jgi:hypothetical protein
MKIKDIKLADMLALNGGVLRKNILRILILTTKDAI